MLYPQVRLSDLQGSVPVSEESIRVLVLPDSQLTGHSRAQMLPELPRHGRLLF